MIFDLLTGWRRFAEIYRRFGAVYAMRRTVDAIWTRTVGAVTGPEKRRRVLRLRSPVERFTEIYKSGYWNSKESRSGFGSTLDAAAIFGGELERFVKERGINSMFDAPCGDWNWMRQVRFPDGCMYIGGDIVPEIISLVSLKYQGPKTRFLVFNIIEDQFPTTDVWLCRDCLFHLSFDDIASTFRNFGRSETPMALITSHPDHLRNLDIQTGDFRFLNLCERPFFLPKPELFLRESVSGEQRIVGLWSRDQLAAAADIYESSKTDLAKRN